MKREMKKVFSFILVLMLIFSLIPSPVSLAAPGPGEGLNITNSGILNTVPQPPNLTNGAIWTNKSVSHLGNGEFQITLSAIGQNYALSPSQNPNPLDIVMVLDCSDSMDEGNPTKLSSMKNAAISAVDILLGVSGNRVSVVKFNNTAVRTVAFSNDRTTNGVVKQGINGLQTTSTTGSSGSTAYTNIQDGFRRAREIINLRGEADKLPNGQFRKPVIILMSDGAPTRYNAALDSSAGTSGSTAYPTTKDAVWWTIKQGMYTKTNGDTPTTADDIDIYTIGFDVNNNADAKATLAPDPDNTDTYRPIEFTGQTRTATQSGKVQYYATRTENRENNWTSWQPSTTPNNVTGLTYVAPIGLTTTGTWTNYSAAGYNITAPTNGNWSAWAPATLNRNTTMLSDPPIVYSNYTSGPNSYARTRAGFYNATQTRTEYQNITGGQVAFAHQYWTKSTLADANLSSILQAFVDLANQLTTYAPTQVVTTGSATYNNVVITDVIGAGFEIVTPLPAGLTYNSTTGAITWSIDGSSFSSQNSMNAGSTSFDASKLKNISFKIKINNAVGSGTYYTNATAGAAATVAAENPAYSTNTYSQALPTTGYLTLEYTPVNATIVIEKTVTGAAIGENSFNFNLYSDSNRTELLTSTSITVTGADTESTTVNLTIPGQKFINGGIATIFVEELGNAPEFWTYDKAMKSVEITRSNPSGTATFTNSYNPEGTLIVNKDWPEGEPNNVTSVAFYLQKKVGDSWVRINPAAPYILKASEGWTLRIPGLTLGTEYMVDELPGYLTQDYYATSSPGSVIIDAYDLEREITIFNQYITPTGDITIKKNWIGGTADDLPNYVIIDYEYDNGEEVTTGSISMDSSEAVTNDGVLTWQLKKSGLGFGTYTFTEQSVQDYKATITTQAVTIAQEPIASRSAVVVFENTYVTPSGTLVVEKKWENENGDTRFRPASIVVQLFQKLAGMDEAVEYDDPVTLSDANGWMTTYNNLVWGEYSIEEISDVQDYTTTYSALSVTLEKGTKSNIDPRTGFITISNIFDNPKGEITVEKNWVESGLEFTDRPSEITVTLYHNNTYYDSVTFSGINNTSSHTFTGLPLSGTYTVSESASGEDADKLSVYIKTVSYGGNNSSIALNPFNRSGNVSLTNTYARGTITVNKIWEDRNNPGAELPEKAVITLYKVTEYVETIEIIGEVDLGEGVTGSGVVDTVTRPATTVSEVETKEIDRSTSPASFSVVFYDLELGEDISYYVEEEKIPFYDTVYSDGVSESDDPEEIKVVLTKASEENENSDNGIITVTNTYNDPRGELTVSKAWVHGNNPNPPSQINVKLYELIGGAPVYVTEKSFSGSSYTFTGLTLGAVYTVEESTIDNYNPSYNPNNYQYAPVKNYNTDSVAPGSVAITNRYIPETGSLQVTKKWEGNTGSAITITLTRYYQGGDGQLPDTVFNAAPPSVVLDESNEWTNTFSGLEVYGPGGVKYDYRARENGTDLWMYTHDVIQDKQLTPKQTTELTIVNEYTPTRGALTITKVWQNGNDYPESINYRLYVNGIAQEGYRTLSAPNWTDTLTELDVTKSYYVEEVNVPEEYGVSYTITEGINSENRIVFDENNLTGEIVITNTRTQDTPQIKLTKAVDKKAVILKDGKAEFTYTLTIENNGNRTLKNIYVDDQMTASGTALDVNIVYVTSSSLELTGTNGARITPLVTTLAPGATTSAVYTVIVDKEGEYNNTAIAYGEYGQTTISTTPAEEKAIVKDLDIQIEKVVLSEKNIRGTGGSFLYQITVRNASEFDFYSVNVLDEMTASNSSATMSYSYTESQGIQYLADEHRFIIGDLLAGSEDVVFTYTVSVSGTGTYDNTATVTGIYENELGEGTRSDSDNESVTVTRRSNPPRDPDPDPEDPDDPDIIIPEEDVPEGAIPDVTLPDDQIPAAPLPRTGGLDSLLIYGLGALLAGGGLFLRRRENKAK